MSLRVSGKSDWEKTVSLIVKLEFQEDVQPGFLAAIMPPYTILRRKPSEAKLKDKELHQVMRPLLSTLFKPHLKSSTLADAACSNESSHFA